MSLKYKDLSKENFEVFVNLILESFENDPLFINLFNISDRQSKFFRRLFVIFLLRMNRVMGGHPRLLYKGEELVGGYLLEPPSGFFSLRSFLALFYFLPLLIKLPLRITKKLNDYFVTTRSACPQEPVHYLTLIAVKTGSQGLGYGKKMMIDIKSYVEKQTQTAGIALDTENAENVKIYKHLGFELYAECKNPDFNIYSMFWKQSC